MLRLRFQIQMTTIQVEEYKAQIMNNCGNCQEILA